MTDDTDDDSTIPPPDGAAELVDARKRSLPPADPSPPREPDDDSTIPPRDDATRARDADAATTPRPDDADAPVDTRKASLSPHDVSAPVRSPAGRAVADPWPHFPEAIRARYVRCGLLGRGGMGVVFEATDSVLGRKVAIKGPVSLTGERSELLRVYTARELRFMARLAHPNILPVYDVWEDAFGNPWCAMLRVAGAAPTLKKRLDDLAELTEFRARPFAELIQIFQQVCRGVAFAHAAGVIHRDLKPDNVLLGPAGEALVGDWGIAAERADVFPEASGIAGTPGYGAPEQLGQAGVPRADQRSDVFALGMILSEMCGLERDAPTFPRELASIVGKATSPEPAARYADVPALLADIDLYLAGGLLKHVSYSWRERVTKWVKRHPGRAGLLAAVAVGVLALVVAVPLLVRSEQAARVAQARAENAARQSGIKLRVARATQTAAGTPERAILDAVSAAQQSLEAREPVMTEVTGACLDALATAGIDRQIDLGRSAPDYSNTNDHALGIAFAPTGRGIVTGHADARLRLWTGNGELDEARFTGHTAPVRAVTFRPDGHAIASGSDDGTVRLWSTDGTPLATCAAGQGFVTAVAFSPDGRTLATGGTDGTVRLWSPALEPAGDPLRGHTRTIRALAFHPAGEELATASDDVTVRIFPLSHPGGSDPSRAASGARGEVRELAGHSAAVRALAVSPDGHLLASASEDRTVRLWSFSGDPKGIGFQGHEAAVHSVTFSPDGETVVSGSADRTIRSWDLAGIPRGAPLEGHTGTVTGVAYRPDGAVLASSSADRTVRLWHMDWTFALDLLCTRLTSSPLLDSDVADAATARAFVRARAAAYARVRSAGVTGARFRTVDLSAFPAGLTLRAADGRALARTPTTSGVVVTGPVRIERGADLKLSPDVSAALSLIENRQIDAPPRKRLLDAAVAGLQAWLDDAARSALDADRLAIEGMLGTLGYRTAHYIPAGFRTVPDDEGAPAGQKRHVSVRGRMLAPGIAYVHVTRFGRFTAPDLASTLDAVSAPAPLAGLVLDCRTALDGPMSAAVETARVLLHPGEIGRTRSRTEPDVIHSAPGSKYAALPLAVLVGKRSCGAAEIVAAAVQHQRRGRIFGQTTPGRIRPRTDHPLPGGATLSLTTQEWLTPRGTCLRDNGVEPDVTVDLTIGTPEDQAALDRWRDAAWEQADALLPPEGLSPVGIPTLDATLRAAVEFIAPSPTPPSHTESGVTAVAPLVSRSTTRVTTESSSVTHLAPGAPTSTTSGTLRAGRPESPHDMVLIPAGSFLMGDDGPGGQELRHHVMAAAPVGFTPARVSDESNDEAPAHRVHLEAFYMDRHAVTNRQFRAFLLATGRRWDASYWNDPAHDGDDQPVVMVDWNDATAYAEWAGLRLPTEAEREKASRGGLHARRYPWGDEDPSGRVQFGVPTDRGAPSRVMSFAPNAYGLFDMAGDIYEWCSDWYARDAYTASNTRSPRGPAQGATRVLRGSGWPLARHNLGCAKRYARAPDQRDVYIGFRCVK